MKKHKELLEQLEILKQNDDSIKNISLQISDARSGTLVKFVKVNPDTGSYSDRSSFMTYKEASSILIGYSWKLNEVFKT